MRDLDTTYYYKGWTIKIYWINVDFGYGCTIENNSVTTDLGNGYGSEGHAFGNAKRTIDEGGPFREYPQP